MGDAVEPVVMDEQAEEDAMLVGFEAAKPPIDGEPPAGTDPPPVVADPPPAPAAATPAAEPPAVKYVADTEFRGELEKLSSGLTQKFDRIFGTLGTVNSRLQELAAAKEQYLQIPLAARERLKTEFPELHTLLMGDDAAPASPPASPSPAPAVAAPSPVVAPEPASSGSNPEEVDQRVALGVLKTLHPDFETIRVSAAFIAWKAGLPQNVREELDSTWDAGFVSGKLTEFKQAQIDAAKAAEAAAEAEKQRLARLSSAITPPGGSPAAGTAGLNADDEEEAAMLQAYRRH